MMELSNGFDQILDSGGELRKMGCSLLRQCRRRTQSETPKNYKRGKLKDKVEKMRHSLDIVQSERIQNVQDFTLKSPLVEPDNNNQRKLTHGMSLFKKKDSKNTRNLNDGGSNNCSCGTDNNKSSPSNSHTVDKRYNSFDTSDRNSMGNRIDGGGDTVFNDSIQAHGISKQGFIDAAVSNESLPEEFHFVESDTGNRRKEKFCFPKMICCRKGRRNASSNSNNNNNNNNKSNYSYTVKEYLRIPQSSASSTIDSESTCVSSIETANSSCPTISSSERSTTFSSDHSSANLSHDSGFDEPKCFINMIYQNHRCKGMYSCHKKEKASLNLHLRNLMNCMPKSFEECEAIPHLLKECSGVTRGGPYLTRRRNAICETSEEMRLKFYDALCAFMTLQAMAKYDFL